MKPDIEYVYNALKQLRFDFKESDRKLFPNEYTFDYGLSRYVRVDGNDLYISKDTFKPLEEELEYANKCHNLAEEIGCPLDVRCKVVCNSFIYGILGNQFIVTGIYEDHFTARVHDDYDDYDYDFEWKDYKQTWWLRKDQSE